MGAALPNPFRAVDFEILLPGTRLARPPRLAPDAPALSAMTDLRTAPVVSARYDTTVQDALQQMKLSGARFAFVVGADGALLGSVTSYDIQGEKPMQYMMSVGCSESTCAWGEVQVENIMEPVARWQVLHLADVARMSAREVADLLAAQGMTHAVVVESARADGVCQVRGLFSAARLQLLQGDAAAEAGGVRQVTLELVPG